ncbi:MAG TPA: hypothetical protein VHS32_10200 [Streptosporangiaceae bacterium]|nr:hypothetical protein [Streptosporangiaceae bacterium]
MRLCPRAAWRARLAVRGHLGILWFGTLLGILRLGGDGADHGVEYLRVGDRHHAAATIETDVRDPDIGHDAVERAAERAGLQPDGVTHLERPREEQHHPGEHVAECLLRGDANEHGGQRAPQDELSDRHGEQLQGDHQRGEGAHDQDGVPGHRRVRGAHPGPEQFPDLPGQAVGRDGSEDQERDGQARGDQVGGRLVHAREWARVISSLTRQDRGGDRQQQGDDRLPRPRLAFDALDLRRQVDLPPVLHRAPPHPAYSRA